MVGTLGAHAGAALDALIAVVGIRAAEEPAYEILSESGVLQLRRYAPRRVAQTLARGEEQAARQAGFSRLAGYIFGGNAAALRIAMTAPVVQAPDAAPRAWRIRFVLPAGLDAAPPPRNPEVEIATLPEQVFAVLRFSGSTGAGAVAAARGRLLHRLAGSGWSATGAAEAWFYDPPWTLPPLRRNEIAAPVARLG
jgi:hypothetical protein